EGRLVPGGGEVCEQLGVGPARQVLARVRQGGLEDASQGGGRHGPLRVGSARSCLLQDNARPARVGNGKSAGEPQAADEAPGAGILPWSRPRTSPTVASFSSSSWVRRMW